MHNGLAEHGDRDYFIAGIVEDVVVLGHGEERGREGLD
jgi:hypothetical protein